MSSFLKKLADNLKGSISADDDQDDDVFGYQEDLRFQTELLPLGAWDFCREQLEKRRAIVAEQGEAGFGHLFIYQRDDPPTLIRDLAIPLSALVDALRPHLTDHEMVLAFGSETYEVEEFSHGWGDDAFAIVADHDDGLVETIWMIFGIDESAPYETMESALTAIPRRDEMLLVDWELGLLIRAGDIDRLRGYLRDRFIRSVLTELTLDDVFLSRSESPEEALAFGATLLKEGRVWTLRDTEGLPLLVDSEEEDLSQPFWSSRERVEEIIHNAVGFSSFEPHAIDLDDFCGAWLPALDNQGMSAALDWRGPERSTLSLRLAAERWRLPE